MKKFIDEIRKAGLNDYEARSYLHLLKMGSGKVSDLAQSASVPRARIYDVLDNLQEKGFVVKKSSRPLSYSALKPGEAFANFADHKKRVFSSHLSELEGITKFVEKQFEFGGEPPVSEKVDSFVVSNRGNIHSKIVSEGLKSQRLFLCGDSWGDVQNNALTDKLKEKGVKASVVDDSSHIPRCVLFDRNGVFLFTSDASADDASEEGIFIRSEPLARSFHNLLKKK